MSRKFYLDNEQRNLTGKTSLTEIRNMGSFVNSSVSMFFIT